MKRHFVYFAAIIAFVLLSPVVGAEKPSARPQDEAWVDQQIEQWQSTKAERAFDDIGWAKSLLEAEQLASKHGRPIFLFTYDGANLAGYRC